MARFDVYTLKQPKDFLVVDIQADFLENLGSRLVIPLLPLQHNDQESIPNLKPNVTLADQTYILMTPEMSSVPVNLLNQKQGSLENQRQIIVESIDFLMQGF